MDISNGIYRSVKMRWKTFTFPIREGTPVNAFGVEANGKNAIGLVPQTIPKKPETDWINVIVGGAVRREEVERAYGESLTDDAVKAMSGIAFYNPLLSKIKSGEGGTEKLATAEKMDEALISDNVGKAYVFTGETGKYINSDLYVVKGDKAPYSFAHFSADRPNYLCFTAEAAGSTVSMASYQSPTIPAPVLETSSDKVHWVAFVPDTTVITLSEVGDKVYFRGDNTTFGYVKTSPAVNSGWKFTMTGRIAASGNVMSILDKNCESLTIFEVGALRLIFQNCSALTSAPELPATALSQACYTSMFYGCTSLTTPPKLPAMTLAVGCYATMFAGCTALTETPKLPAATVVSTAYIMMFNGCTSLTTLPALPATTIDFSAYYGMFQGCSGIKISATSDETYTTPYRIPSQGTAGTPGDNAFAGMFSGTGGSFTGDPSVNTTYYLA